MKSVRCDKCWGKGTIEVEDKDLPCEATIVIGDEPVHCFAEHAHPDAPHMAILCNPCIMCGQFDECHVTCGIYDMEPSAKVESSWWSWRDGDLSLTRVAEGVGQAWRNEHQPGSPYARPVEVAA